MRRILYAVAVAAAFLVPVVPASAAPVSKAADQAVYIRMAGTGRCVTAPRARAGAAVVALRCRHRADQRWVLGNGTVRLNGTRLRMVVSRKNWLAILALPRSWREGWKVNGHHLIDQVLSRRFRVRVVLTLPRRPIVHHHRLVGGQPYQMGINRLVHHVPIVGFQGIRLSRA